MGPSTPAKQVSLVWAHPLSLATTYGITSFSFPGVTEMFHFAPFRSLPTMNSSGSSLSGGLPHSEIHGSKPVCGSPWLIAANHVLHRLLAPRYSPPALSSLVKLSLSLSNTIVFELYCSLSLAFVSFVLGVLPRVRFPVRFGLVKNQFVQEQEHVLYPFSSSFHATFKEQPQIL